MQIKNMKALREFLAENMEKHREGEILANDINAAANMAGKILNSVKIELEHSRITGSTKQIDFLNYED